MLSACNEVRKERYHFKYLVELADLIYYLRV